MKLYAKLKLWSWKNNMEFYDEDGKILYTARGLFNIAGKRHALLYDATEHELLELKQRALTMKMTMDVFEKGEPIMLIRKKSWSFRPVYEVEGPEWSVSGSFSHLEFDINDADAKLVATIAKKRFRWSDEFEIEIWNEKIEPAYIIAVVLTIQAELAQQRALMVAVT